MAAIWRWKSSPEPHAIGLRHASPRGLACLCVVDLLWQVCYKLPAVVCTNVVHTIAGGKAMGREEMLKKVPMFSELGRKDLDRLAKLMVPRTVKAGETIIKENDQAAGFFVMSR
jgi:hypothetical protein